MFDRKTIHSRICWKCNGTKQIVRQSLGTFNNEPKIYYYVNACSICCEELNKLTTVYVGYLPIRYNT